eukprot:s5288_g3.t1
MGAMKLRWIFILEMLESLGAVWLCVVGPWTLTRFACNEPGDIMIVHKSELGLCFPSFIRYNHELGKMFQPRTGAPESTVAVRLLEIASWEQGR